MIGLAIHTSSPELGLALTHLDNSEIHNLKSRGLNSPTSETTRRHQIWPLGRDLTQYLHVCLAEFIYPHAWTDLAFLAVAKGPGGFTGTRIGVVVARTLAQQIAIPLFGVSSLAAIAQHYYLSAPESTSITDLAVVLRAQREEVFGALYRPHQTGLTTLIPEAVRTPADWAACLDAQSHPYELIAAEGGLAASVTGVLSLAHLQWMSGDRPAWQTVLPFYGQHPVHR
ncbi:MAG: tRNA (adenosine(37)-N6)-threonylcarbamoyltransferase complex dimerization subunit type 1 TsaB [Cyanobacteria bacterium J06626_18]